VNRLRTLLIATILSVGACSCAATATVAAAGLAPVAPDRAHTASHRSKHAHTSCRAKRARHARQNDHRNRQRCHTLNRAIHNRRSRHGEKAPTRSASGASARRAHATETNTSVVTLTASPASQSIASPPATIAIVLATPCQNTELTPDAVNIEQVEAATVCLVNQERARNDELPLQLNPELTQVARTHSQDMLSEDYFSHTTPSGETQLQRVQASGYIPNAQVGYTVGENIAWGTGYLATPSSIVAAWIASPEHLANILNGSYRDTGMGVDPAAPPSLAEGQLAAIYTQEFGVIDG
jgi:uncharacterized protein YkwD